MPDELIKQGKWLMKQWRLYNIYFKNMFISLIVLHNIKIAYIFKMFNNGSTPWGYLKPHQDIERKNRIHVIQNLGK